MLDEFSTEIEQEQAMEKIEGLRTVATLQIGRRLVVEDEARESQQVYITVAGNDGVGYVAFQEQWFIGQGKMEPEFYLVDSKTSIYTTPQEAINEMLMGTIAHAITEKFALDIGFVTVDALPNGENDLVCANVLPGGFDNQFVEEVFRLQIGHKIDESGVLETIFLRVFGNEVWGYRSDLSLYKTIPDATTPKYHATFFGPQEIYFNPQESLDAVIERALHLAFEHGYALDDDTVIQQGKRLIFNRFLMGIPAEPEPEEAQPKHDNMRGRAFSSALAMEEAFEALENLPRFYRFQIGHRATVKGVALIREIALRGNDDVGYQALYETLISTPSGIALVDTVFVTSIFDTPGEALRYAFHDAILSAEQHKFSLDCMVEDSMFAADPSSMMQDTAATIKDRILQRIIDEMTQDD